MSTLQPARTYNQNHIPRKYTPGKRRLSIYWTWSYPWESQRDPAAMENRFSTMTEVRTVLWPNYETPEWSMVSEPKASSNPWYNSKYDANRYAQGCSWAIEPSSPR